MSKVVLQQTLADSMRNNDHVIVTTNDIGGENITWSKVDRTSLTNSSSRIPASKFVYELSSDVRDLSNDVSIALSSIDKLILSSTALSSSLTSLIDGSAGQIGTMSANINTLSSNLSDLYHQKVVKFIGVSETDPLSGVLTIDGNVYYLSDFNESNNGNVVYYRTTIDNHAQCDGRSDQHQHVDAVSMLYAYIYANGVLNDAGQVQINSTDTGHFTKYGYAFFENLSTLIHDDMVCDYANIKMYKISGLISALDANQHDHSQLCSDLSQLRNSLSIYQLKSDSQLSVRNLSTDIQSISSDVNVVKNSLSNYLAKTVRVNSLTAHPDSDYYMPTVHAVQVALNTINETIVLSSTTLATNLATSVDTILDKLQLSVDSLLNILSTVLRPEVNSVNKSNQIISGYTW